VVCVADRTITIRIGANVTGLMAGLRTAQTAAKDFTNRTLDGVQRNSQAISTLSTNAGVAGLALTGLAAVAVRSFMNFDAAMSNVAATGDDARGAIDGLRAAAIQAGADTVFSATEAAGAVENLAKAGVSAKDTLAGGLTGSLNLAAAGELDVAKAAELAASALTQFGLSGSQTTHVADLLAAGAGKAQGSVEDMGMALNQSGLVANQMGLSIEETVGSLTAFASAGLTGSDAGTSFRAMLLRLANPTAEASTKMSELGIAAYDTQGNFVGMESLAGQLKTQMGGLTQEARNQALALIFGQDAIRTSSILYEQGAEGIAEWTAKVNDTGYAAEVAATRMDNLKGDLEQLSGSLDTALIGMGEGANGPLRSLVQGLTDAVNAFGELPEPVQQATLALIGGSGLVLLGVAGMGKLLVSITETRAAMAALGVTTADVKTKMVAFGRTTGIAAGIAALTWGLDKYADSQVHAAASTEQTTAALLSMQDASDLDAMFEGIGFGADDVDTLNDAIRRLANPSMMDKISDFEGTLRGLLGSDSNVNDMLRDQFDEIGASLAALVESGDADRAATMFGTIADEWEAQGGKLEDLQGLMPAYADALAGVENEARLASESGDALAATQQYVGQTTEEATKALEDWRAMVAESDASFISLTDGYQSVIDANTAYAESTAKATRSTADDWTDYYDGVAVSADEFISQLQAQVDAQTNWETNMLDIAARVRDGMTGDMADAANQMIDELLDLGPEGAAQVQLLHDMSAEQFAQVVTLWQQKGTAAVTAFTDQVEAYRQPVIEVTANMDPAYARVAEFARDASGLRIGLNAAGQQIEVRRPNGVIFKAGGGEVTGPGTGTSDSVIGRLSNGEHVLTAAEVGMAGGQAAVYRMRAAIRSGVLRGFRDGGAVQGYAGGGGVYAQRQYAGTPQSSGGGAGAGTRTVEVTQNITVTDPLGAAIAANRRLVELGA
jgi:TP901 family phage tail tape measure protein